MSRTQRKYDQEYKIQAVKLAKEIGGAKAAKELGIPEGTIHTWLKAVRAGTLDIGDGAHTPESAMSLAEELAESTEQLGANNYERSQERSDYRNGTRTRSLTTRIGKIELQVPRHRNVPFKTSLFENYQRNEQALITTMMEMVVQGISTRNVKKVTDVV